MCMCAVECDMEHMCARIPLCGGMYIMCAMCVCVCVTISLCVTHVYVCNAMLRAAYVCNNLIMWRNALYVCNMCMCVHNYPIICATIQIWGGYDEQAP